MKKKVLLVLISMVTVLQNAFAYDFSAISPTGQTLCYNIIGNDIVEVTYQRGYVPTYINLQGDLSIPSTVSYEGQSYTVVSIGTEAFESCSDLTSVEIPNSITTIEHLAFSGCTGLVSISLPDSLTIIEIGVFRNCTSLTSISIPQFVTTISPEAFENCTSLATVILPNSVTNIDDNSFFNCSGITSPVFNSSCFVRMPTSYSGHYDIPYGIIKVCTQAFKDCSHLSEISIPQSVVSIGCDAFSNCENLNTVFFNADNCVFMGEYGRIYNQDAHPAFYNCPNIISILFGNNVTNIPQFAFNGCQNLSSVIFGDSISNIGNDAFSQCTRLTSVSFGEGIANIGDNAFLNCGIIGELVIPQGLIAIGSNSFKDCYGITEITCLGRVAPTFGSNAFDGVDTGITVNIPCGTTNLYAGRWSYFHNFNEIPFLFNVASADLAQGTVAMLQEPTCDDPVAIVLASPRDGYRFDHWSDGSTQNPYTYTAMGSLTLTAYFASTTEGINDIEMDGIRLLSVDGRIVVESGDGGTLGEVRVFDVTGRMLSEAHPALSGHPSRGEGTGWRAEFEVPASGMYVVKIGDQTARKIVVIR